MFQDQCTGAPKAGERTESGCHCHGRIRPSYHADVILSMGSRLDEDAIAQHLYRILRECDELHVDAIYSESFQTPRIGQAIMNRLLKAAGHTVIHCD